MPAKPTSQNPKPKSKSLWALSRIQPLAAAFTELGIGIVRCAARRAGTFRRRRREAGALREFLLDLIAIARRALIELPQQARGADAQARTHLGEVFLRELPHCVIEFKVLDGAERQRLLAFERGPRAAPENLGAE